SQRQVLEKAKEENYKINELVKRSEDEIFITENAHEAIISKQDFDLVQKLMQVDTRISPEKDKLHLFSGMLICGCCGNRMTRKTVTYKGNKYFYYYCPTGKKNGCKGANMVKEDDLIECVTESIKSHITNVASLRDILSGIDSTAINTQKCRSIKAQLEELQKQLKKKADYKAKLYENFVSGILDKDDYKALKTAYSSDEQKLNDTITKLESELDECVNNTSKKALWTEHFQRYENIEEIDRNTVVQLIVSIKIFDKTHLQITFNYEDEYAQALSVLEDMTEAV
ncbi:MAG: recombinase zinc beta ribbon domain-containing protein, partial [Firmicutes bacterium]|nr:recombinase zinc beta ribbon domain-containing protein [Bacillota bacterium]